MGVERNKSIALAAGNSPMSTQATPDSTAIRTALWRAVHVEVDALPHVL